MRAFALGIVPLVFLVAVVTVFVLLVRRSRTGKEAASPNLRPGAGAGLVRRLYYYGIAFIALMVAASGATLLLGYAADRIRGPEWVAGGTNGLALGLALTIVGTPIWLAQWSLAQRSARRSPVEAQSLVRKVYLYLVLGVSLGAGAAGLVTLFQWLLRGDDFRGSTIAPSVVWGVVWGFHWWVESVEGQSTDEARFLRRLYVYGASAAGLAMLCIGFGMVIQVLLREGYNGLFVTPRPPSELWDLPIRESLGTAIVGAAVWGWHWLWVARHDTHSRVRRVYLYLFAIPGGAAAMLAGGIAMNAFSFKWLLGTPDLPNSASYFDFFPGTLAALMVGALVWAYHWRMAQREAKAASEEPAARRWYRYLMSGLGMGALATGLVLLLTALLELAAPQAREELASPGSWRGTMGLALGVLLVGAPLWGSFWRAIQQAVQRGATNERQAISRRVFVYLVFAVAVLMALGNFSAVLYQVFRDALDKTLAAGVLSDVKWSLGMLVTAAAGSVYYWRVLQDDRRALAAVEAAEPARPARKRVTVLASTQALPVVRRLETMLGYSVLVWTRPAEEAGGEIVLTDDQLQVTVASISTATTRQVLAVVDAAGIHIFPYEEKEAA